MYSLPRISDERDARRHAEERVQKAHRRYNFTHQKVTERLALFFDVSDCVDRFPASGDPASSRVRTPPVSNTATLSTATVCSTRARTATPQSPILALEDLCADRTRLADSNARASAARKHESKARMQRRAGRYALRYLESKQSTDKRPDLRLHCFRKVQVVRGVLDLSCQELDRDDLFFASEVCASRQDVTAVNLTNASMTPKAFGMLVGLVAQNKNITRLTPPGEGDALTSMDDALDLNTILQGVSIAVMGPTATDEPRLPVSEVRLRKLAACVRQNRAEKLNVTEQAGKQDVLDVVAKRRSDFVAQLLATLELEETERQQFTQARVRELAAASAVETQERTKLQRNAQRQLLRADRLRRIASLTVSEVAHRRRLLEAWHMVWPPVAEKLECRTRTALLKAESDDRTALLALSAEECHEARRRERLRLDGERRDKVHAQALEKSGRKIIHSAHDKAWAALRHAEEKSRQITRTHGTQRIDLIREERGSRVRVAHEESEGWKWVIRRRDIAEQQRKSELERQRQVLVKEEYTVREVIITEEEVIRPLIEDLITTCKGMALANELFTMAAVDRKTALGNPPLLAVKVPDDKPERYICRQHLQDMHGGTAPKIIVEPSARLLSELPVDWIDKLREIEEKEEAEHTRRAERLEKQQQLQAESKEKLGSVADAMLLEQMIAESLKVFTPIDSCAQKQKLDIPRMKKRKESILGGTITFWPTPCKDLPAAPRYEVLTAKDPSWLDAPQDPITRESITRTVQYHTVDHPQDDAFLLTMHVPRGGTTVQTVQDMLRGCEYSTTIDEIPIPVHREIGVRVTLYFADVSDESDPFLTAETPVPQGIMEVTSEAYLSLVLTPPYLWVPRGQRSLTFVEGDTVERSVLFTDLQCQDIPIITRRNGVVTTATSTIGTGAAALVSFEGSTLEIRFESGYTATDVVVFKSGSDTYFSDLDKTIRVQEVPVAKIIEGCLRKSTGLTPGSGKPGETCERVVLKIISPATADVIKKMFLRLRYYNYSLDPVEGKRLISFTLSDPYGTSAIVSVSVNVEATDNPAVLNVPTQRRYYHFVCSTTGIPSHLRQYVEPQDFMLFAEASVEDVDTDHFCGGHMACTISGNWQKGDFISFHPACFEAGFNSVFLEPVQPGDHNLLAGKNSPGYEYLWDVSYRNRKIGVVGFYEELSQKTRTSSDVHMHTPSRWDRLQRGSREPGGLSIASTAVHLLEARRKQADEDRKRELFRGSPVDGRAGRRLYVLFGLHGEASIESTEAIMRCMTFSPTSKPGDHIRRVELEIQTGVTVGKRDSEGNAKIVPVTSVDPSSLQPPLKGSVEVKVTPALVSVPGRSALLKYVEGSGAVRVAPFEVPPESTTDGFENGFVRVEIVEGGCTDDVVGIRDDGLQFRLRDCYDYDIPLNELVAYSERYDEVNRRGKFEDDSSPKGKKVWGENKAFSKATTIQEGKQYSSVSDVVCDGKVVGYLSMAPHALQLTFARTTKAEKERVIGRKELVTILKALTYSNISKDPQELGKILVVSVSDGSPLVSQAVIEIQVQPVDDVTEIVLRNDRVKYYPCETDDIRPLLIAPLSTAHIEDPDTNFFDGGFLSAELIAGASKGDHLGLLTLQQQVLQINELMQPKRSRTFRTKSFRRARMSFTGELPTVDINTIADPEQYLFDFGGNERRIVSLDGSFSASLTYPQTKNCREAHDVRIHFPKMDNPVIDKEVISFVLNCITFGSHMKERVREGSRTILIRVSDGVNPQEGKVKITIDVRAPFLFNPNLHPVDIVPGAVVAVAPKIVVSHSDAGGFIVTGFVEIEIVEGFSPGDSLVVNLKEGGFSLKEGYIYSKASVICYLTVNTSEKLRLDFVQGSKATQKNLLSILRSVGFKFPSKTSGGDRVVLITGTSDRPDRVNRVSVTLAGGSPKARR
ncbi:hypothetical protein DIPPA_19320 [Diplonema papillatum]|nr:hypothetical protein DIPPA_19320 [Diplonema papillatum]